MKGSILVDIGASSGGHGRLIHPLEHFAAMGFPVFVGAEVARDFPLPFRPGFLETLTPCEARRLTGN
eukprot:11167334-Lingulodinium_polyedra.AAC.1